MMAPVGVVPLLGGTAEVVTTSLAIISVWLMSPGERLGPELDRRNSGVLNVVPLLGASRLETRLAAPNSIQYIQ